MIFEWKSSPTLLILQALSVIGALAANLLLLRYPLLFLSSLFVLIYFLSSRPPRIQGIRFTVDDHCYLYHQNGSIDLAQLLASSVITHTMLYLVFKTVNGKRRCCIAKDSMEYTNYRRLASNAYNVLSKPICNR